MTHAERKHGADIPKDRLPDGGGKLVEVLMGKGQAEPVLSGLRQQGGEGIRGEVLELIDEQMEITAFLLQPVAVQPQFPDSILPPGFDHQVHFGDQSEAVRRSIEFVFSDFSCEELIKHLDDWSESHLKAYAKMVRIAEVGFIDFIERDAQSQSAVKRCRAIHAVRFLGMENGLADVTLDALQDKCEKVRIEAVYAIAAGRSRANAIETLRPLTRDEEPSVITAANFALSSLGM